MYIILLWNHQRDTPFNFLIMVKRISYFDQRINTLAKVQKENFGWLYVELVLQQIKNNNLPVINTTQSYLIFLEPTQGIYIQNPSSQHAAAGKRTIYNSRSPIFTYLEIFKLVNKVSYLIASDYISQSL